MAPNTSDGITAAVFQTVDAGPCCASGYSVDGATGMRTPPLELSSSKAPYPTGKLSAAAAAAAAAGCWAEGAARWTWRYGMWDAMQSDGTSRSTRLACSAKNVRRGSLMHLVIPHRPLYEHQASSSAHSVTTGKENPHPSRSGLPPSITRPPMSKTRRTPGRLTRPSSPGASLL